MVKRINVMKSLFYNSLNGARAVFLLVALILVFSGFLYGQPGSRGQIRSGNKAYNKGDFNKAEEHYRKGLGGTGTSVQGHFNLGNTLYRQQNYDGAYDQYRLLSGRRHDSITTGRIYYNLGNSALQQYLSAGEGIDSGEREKYLRQGIDAYSHALRYNPKDEDARHNLTLALQLRNSSPPQKQNPQEQHEQDRKKQEQPLPETKIREDESEQTKPDHEEGKISREDAERMLNAIREKEMNTAEQINARERKRKEKGKLKDW